MVFSMLLYTDNLCKYSVQKGSKTYGWNFDRNFIGNADEHSGGV